MPRWSVGLVFVVVAILALGGYGVFTTPTEPSAKPTPQRPTREAFAADRDPVPGEPVPFDGERAMRYLEDICKIGPRISGTEGMKKQQELVQKHFEALGGKVELQRFTAVQESQGQPVAMANVIASWHPERLRRVIICSHYDTRPIADQEPDPRKWHEPFVSANDGGSGVALLMELAHSFKDLKTSVGVDLVLFDGEEYIFDAKRDKYFFGSEHFARAYQKNRPTFKYVGAILLDMIAGKNGRIPVEQNSWFQARALAEEIWGIATELKCDIFKQQLGDQVLDDHLALNRAGIPAIDLIDFSYPHWHRLSDVPAQCSAAAMTQVARVLSVWLQRVK